MKKKKQNLPLNLIERMNSRIGLIASIVVLVLLILFFNQLDYNLIQKPIEEAKKAEEQAQEEAEEAAAEPTVTTVRVVAVGDNLFHTSLIEHGENDSGEWNYDDIYVNVKDEISSADIAMVDQETGFTTDHDAVSGYPSFATPTEVGDALINAGFDVIESATNHCNDLGTEEITDTLNFWNTSYPDIPVLGIHETQEDADTVQVMEVNGIKIAFLNYTYGTNINSNLEEKEYMVDIFDKDKVTAMVQKAKEQSDCVIFVAHWGKEEEAMPTEYEKEWATYLMQLGVDVLVGGHPHIIQPYGRMSDENGNEMVIFYSLGNFVSGQQDLTGLLEGMADFTIQKSVKGEETTISIVDETVHPMVMHYNKANNVFTPYMLKDYTEELASEHTVRTELGLESFTLENLKAKFEEIMSMNVEPSANTDLLDASYDENGDLIDADGNYIDDIWSISADTYLSEQASSDDSEDSEDSEDTSYYDDSEDDSYYDDSEDDSYYDDSEEY